MLDPALPHPPHLLTSFPPLPLFLISSTLLLVSTATSNKAFCFRSSMVKVDLFHDFNAEDLCFLSIFFLTGRRWDVSERGKSDGCSAQCWMLTLSRWSQADVHSEIRGHCPPQTMNTVCLTPPPIFLLFFIWKTFVALKSQGWWEKTEGEWKWGRHREWMLTDYEATERIEGRCAKHMMPVVVLPKQIRTFQTTAYYHGIMQEKISQQYSSPCLADTESTVPVGE